MAWSLLTDDNFTEADTTPGATLPGPASFYSPSAGGAYLDNVGSTWQVVSKILLPVNIGVGLTAYENVFLNRPVAETQTTSRIDAVVNLNGNINSTPCLVLRNSSGVCYIAIFYYGPNTPANLAIGRMTAYSTAFISLASNTNVAITSPVTSSPDYILSFIASGTSPTTLTLTLALASSPTTIISTVSTTDSTAGLQGNGVAGITANYNTTQFKRVTTYQILVAALAIGKLSLTESDTGLTLSLSAGLSGGTGTGYQYNIYRGTTANFTANGGSLLTTVSSMPYTDTTPASATKYFYGVIGNDSSTTTVTSLPAGLSVVGSIPVQYVEGTLQQQPIVISFIGDSITYGAGVSNAGTTASPTVPYFVITRLYNYFGARAVFGYNSGLSGSTTTDWAPGGTLYNNAIQASNASSGAHQLLAATPQAKLVVNIMLGTNDAASSGTNNGGIGRALTAAEYQTKMTAIVNQILTVDYPNATIILHYTKWFSPNTNNSAVYLQAALDLVSQYNATLPAIVALYPGKVYLGDTYAYDYFAQNYQAELQTESGVYGNFFLHPKGTVGTNGKIGTQSLGEFWAEAIANILYGTGGGSSTGSRRTLLFRY